MEKNTQKYLQTDFKNGVCRISLDRPKKFNALTFEMYAKLIEIFKEANRRDDIKLVYLRSFGDFFSSGNDLSAMQGDFSFQEIEDHLIGIFIIFEFNYFTT